MATGTAGSTARSTHLQVVHYLRKSVGFASMGKDITVGVLPAGAIILGVNIMVETGFDDTGTDLMNVGVTANGTDFFSGQSVATAGKIGATLTTVAACYSASEQTIYARYTGQNANATVGTAEIMVEYAPNNG